MLLKNKKTGEIVELEGSIYFDSEDRTFEVGSIEALNEEWEDVPEEPKEFWYISDFGYVFNHVINNKSVKSTIEEMKSIGNYFETKEEAERAVGKLKAWKRLKDYNVKFNLDFVKNKIDFTYTINNPLLGVLDGEEQIFNNMKIVFGGEE